MLFAGQCYSSTWFFKREPRDDRERSYSNERPVERERGRTYGYPRNSQGYANQRQYGEFSNQPEKIALLLPLSGKHAEAAKAIRDGFFASYYASTASKPIIKVYDTSRGQSVQKVYEFALDQGADFVVGPLVKEDVQDLSLMPHYLLKVPVLALNYSPEAKVNSRQFVQYSLAPEAEAAQVAEKAWQKGYRSASIIVADNPWGKRVAAAFTARWEKHHGRLLQTIYVNASADQAEAVRRLLAIDESQMRANKIKNVLSEKVDFKPRRRQDVDVIFMAAPPEQARQLKPLFDFYYAEDVPVYATSSVYSGHPNPKRDRDINGVIFLDMPWLLDPTRAEQMAKLLGNKGGRQNEYNRLFAMGVDAYNISYQFKQLQSGGNYAGATGDLTIRNKQVRRGLILAEMKDGVPVAVGLPVVAPSPTPAIVK